jgi:hypothetical protein
MNLSLMSQFYHGLVIQRGPWEDQQVVPPIYTKPPSSVVGAASHTTTPSKYGLINQPVQDFLLKNPYLAPQTKYNTHIYNLMGLKAAGVLRQI